MLCPSSNRRLVPISESYLRCSDNPLSLARGRKRFSYLSLRWLNAIAEKFFIA